MPRAHLLIVASLSAAAVLVGLRVASQTRRPHDDSTPSPAGGVSAVDLDSRALRTLHGAVERIDPPTGITGVEAWTRVRIAGAGDADARTFLALVDRGGALPFAVGQLVDASIDCRTGGFHEVCRATVRDADGALLLAYAGDGDASAAPGWTVAIAPHGAGDPRDERPLVLTHAGRSVVTSTTGWRRVVASDGAWRVYGSRTEWAGHGGRPPDSTDYSSFAITRAR